MIEIKNIQGNTIAQIEGDSLRFSTLKRLSLKNADLRGADFLGSTIIAVDFSGADLTGASFEGVSMCDCIFDEAITDGVRWPAWSRHTAYL